VCVCVCVCVCVFQHACASKIGQTVCLDGWMNEWMDGNSI